MDYDVYAGRYFEDWELSIIFQGQFSDDQLQNFVRCVDDENQGAVHIGILFDYLYNYMPNLNIVNINQTPQSTWEEKKKRIAVKDKQLFAQLAETIKA